MKSFYVYVYLNPLKEGNYIYGDYKFNMEPFYVGKGKGRQYKRHLNESLEVSSNSDKTNTISEIKKSGDLPIILKIKESLYENDAFILEKELISLIGRKIDGGPLTNILDSGKGRRKLSKETRYSYGNGTRGKTYEEIYGVEKAKKLKESRAKSNRERKISNETKNKISEKLKDYHNNINKEEYWNYGGGKYSSDTLKKMSESKMGKNNPMYGKSMKPIKIRAFNIEKNEDIIFDSKNKARIFFDISIQKLNRAIEKSEQIKGYVLSYNK